MTTFHVCYELGIRCRGYG